MTSEAPAHVFSILPDGTAELLRPDLVPEGMPVDPVNVQVEDLAEMFVHHRKDGYVYDNNGFLYRLQVVSDDPAIQARYLAFRDEGCGHSKAKRNAHRHPNLVLTDEELERLYAALDSGTEDEKHEACSLPYRDNDPNCPFHRYQRMRIDGTSHKLAVMLSTQSFPGVRTDATFNRGRCNGNQFETHPELGDQYRRLADAAGVNTTGKHYCSGLADFPGDPTAWICDRNDVLRVAREKGYRVSGDVNYNPGEREPMPDVDIAPDIVDRFVDDYMENQPGERRADVQERLTELLAGRVDPNPLLVQDPPPDTA